MQFLRLGGVDAVMSVINTNMQHTRVMEAACFLLGNVCVCLFFLFLFSFSSLCHVVQRTCVVEETCFLMGNLCVVFFLSFLFLFFKNIYVYPTS